VLAVCIYCKRLSPAVRSSVAHIFPDALGGTVTSDAIVRRECNGSVNQDVEMRALDQFRLFRSLLGIEGRRGGIPGVPGTIRVEGQEIRTVLGPGLTPTGPVYREEEDEQGKKSYFAYGPDEARAAFVAEIARKRPNVNWKTSRYNVEIETIADGPALEDPILRRLAAKVAFERLAQLRGASIAADPEFDVVRNFILTGVETLPCCGITADPLLLERSFNFLVPVHAVVIVFHEADPFLGGFVMFFGLYLSGSSYPGATRL
jgi:HNH endonuclease